MLAIRSPSGQSVTDIQLFVDGIAQLTSPPSALHQGPVPSEQEFEETFELELPNQACVIQARARTDKSGFGPVSVVNNVRWAQAASVSVLRPKLTILAIGVGTFKLQPSLRLPFMAQNAKDFVEALSRRAPPKYREVIPHVLTEEEATLNRVMKEFEWLRENTTKDDVTIVYLSGHGVSDKGTKLYRYLTYDIDENQPWGTSLDGGQLSTQLESIPGRKYLFLDTCRSASLPLPNTLEPEAESLANRLSDSGIVVFAAADRQGSALVNTSWGNSAFTKVLKEAFLSEKKSITVDWLSSYLSQGVSALTKEEQITLTGRSKVMSKDYEIVGPML